MLFVGVLLDVYVKGERYGHFNGLIKNKMYEIDHEWQFFSNGLFDVYCWS